MRQTLAFCASEQSFRDLQGLFGFSGRKAPVGSTLLNHQLSLPRSAQIDALRMSTPMPGLRLHGQMQSSGAMDSRGALRDSIPVSFSDCSYAHASITGAWDSVNRPFDTYRHNMFVDMDSKAGDGERRPPVEKLAETSSAFFSSVSCFLDILTICIFQHFPY